MKIQIFKGTDDVVYVDDVPYYREAVDLAKAKKVLEKWELWYRRFPSRRWDPGTVRDYIALNRNWASEWLGLRRLA